MALLISTGDSSFYGGFKFIIGPGFCSFCGATMFSKDLSLLMHDSDVLD